MPNLSPKFLEAIRRRQVKICELYDFVTRYNTEFNYTTHDDVLLWGNPSKRYLPVPIKRGEISTSLNLQSDTVDLEITGISDELLAAVEANELDGLKITIKRALWSEEYGEGCEQVIFCGVGSPEYSVSQLRLVCVSVLSNLNIQVPRNLYQGPCNWVLWGTNCKLIQNEWEETKTANLVSPDYFSFLDSTFTVPVDDLTYWDLGELHATSGANNGVRRMIRRAVDHILYVATPFPYKMQVGDTVVISPGCPKVCTTCRDRFDNQDNFFGFIYIPPPEYVACQ